MGPVAPFDAASIFLAIGMAIIISSWTKNYGDSSESKDLMTQFRGAAVAIASGLSLPPLSLSYIYRRSMKNPKWQSCNYAYISFCLLNLDLIVFFFFCVKTDEKIALLGAIQSLFEGSMYTFVFLWTPALSPNGEDIPHGFIFATFMLSSMLGSSLASRLLARASIKVESYMQIVFIISSASLLLPVITSVRQTF